MNAKERSEYMQELEINQENYQIYQTFLDTKRRSPLVKHRMLWDLGILFTCGAVFLSGFVNFCYILLKLGLSHFMESLVVTLYVAGYIVGAKILVPKIVDFMLIKNFQRKYPNFDINIDATEVEKELEKYYQLSKLPKDIVKQKEEHLENYGESMKEISVEERLKLLKREKEFWEQVAIQEKYQETGEETIGQTSTKKEEKVYHI